MDHQRNGGACFLYFLNAIFRLNTKIVFYYLNTEERTQSSFRKRTRRQKDVYVEKQGTAYLENLIMICCILSFKSILKRIINIFESRAFIEIEILH